jgi:hypothetical protein
MEITSRIVAFDRFWFLPVHSNGIRRQKRNALRLAPKKKTPAKAVTHVSLLCTRSASMSFFESVILLEGREL